MKILNINARQTNQTDVALPFETDVQVSRAWEYLVAGGHLGDFSYRPESEGENEDRAFIADYLRRRAAGEFMDGGPEANQIRRLISNLWGADLSCDIRELLGVDA